MKYLIYFLLLISFGLLTSCDSPNQAVNEPPIVTIISNDSTLAHGDTLKIILHAANLSLANGTVDFKDGNIVEFNNLKGVLDTTLIHCFKSIGLYDITASFTNGDKTTTKHFNVKVSKSLPLVTILTNTTIVDVDDTLKVTLHVSDATLLNGSLDFNDGTVISFDRLNHVLDTIVAHKFASVRSYNITASFSNSDTTTTKYIGVQVKDIPPTVHFTVNSETLRLGDTLKVILRASDATLLNGSLDFNDGTIIYFSKLYRVLDTMIVHLFSQPITYYVNATFSDGHNSNYWQISVMVTRYYELSLSVGMQWQFRHHDGFSAVIGDHINNTSNGIHEWKIISFSSQDSIFTVERTICDTVHESSDRSDTTYIVNSSSQFTIVVLYKTIQFNLPLTGSPFTVPNHSSVTSYPVKASGSTYPSGDLICTDIIGPTAYHYNSSTMYSNTMEELTLIDFIKP